MALAGELPAARGPLTCERCGSREARYAVSLSADAIARLCWRCFAVSRRVVMRALATAVAVGTALTLLNHGDHLLLGRLDGALLWKVPLTYAVPYVVTVWGALSANR